MAEMSSKPIRWPNFSNHLDSLLKERKVTTYRIAQDTELNDSNLSPILAGTARATDRTLRILAQYKPLAITFEQLIKWRLEDEEPEALEVFDEPNELGPLRPVDGFYRFPCLGRVSAGTLTLCEEVDTPVYYEWTEVDLYSKDMFCLEVVGDSMEPDIKHGDILLVEPARSYKPGRTYVVQTTENEATVKVLEMGLDGVTLNPLNPKYKPIKLNGEQIYKAWEVIESKRKWRRQGK